MQSNYFCRTPLESSSVFWKSEENFNLEELTNPILVGNKFTENFIHCRHCRGNFPKRLKQYPQLLLFTNLSITVKSNQFEGKKNRSSDFLKKQRNKESKFLLDILQYKKNKKIKQKQTTNILKSS